MAIDKRAGRPSVAGDRRRQIVAAFVELIAERGLEGVTLDDVSRAAGLQRSVVRHFVGNRADLLRAAVGFLVERYRSTMRAAVGDTPSTAALLDHLFSATWTADRTTEDGALDVLFQEASRDPAMRAQLRDAYVLLTDEVSAALVRDAPDVDAARVATAAYLIVCLAETNADLQRLGFPPERGVAARRHAHEVVERLRRP